jgi:RNA polymerase sigma-70 factor (ECF subfamily)
MPKIRQTRFPTLYETTIAPLRRYLARMLGNPADAQDIAHDAYACVYKAMDAKWPDHPEAFLFTTARRLALNQIRRRRIGPEHGAESAKIIEFTPADTPSVDRIVMAREEWFRLEAAIASLPKGCRQVLLMRKVEQLSHAEIGAALGIAVSTVEKQHARALRLVRAAMQESGQTTNQDQKQKAGGKAAGP